MGFDSSDVRRLKDAVKTAEATSGQVADKIAKELAARLLRDVIKRTPTGKSVEIYKSILDINNKHVLYKRGKKKGKAKYKKITVHTGGTLKKGWTVTDLSFFGGHMFKISNNIFYCTYVENGHRQKPGRYVPAIGKRLKRSWAPGKHMLSISAEMLQKNAQAIIDKRINEWLNEVMK